jgi:hypothetical protein
MTILPTGAFTCEIVLRRVRAPQFVREEREGVTYLVARDYELVYDTILRFAGDVRLPVRARLIGELNQRLVIRDAAARPVRYIGYAQGRVEVIDSDALVMFRGRYYDSRVAQPLSGGDTLTPVGQSVVDHWESAFGEGAYAGHAFSVGGRLTREGEMPLSGEAHGHSD